MLKPKSYVYHIAISTSIFIFVIAMALITSQSFGNNAIDDANKVNGMSGSESWESLSNQQQASIFTALSLQKIPPNSEKELFIGVILGLIFGYFAVMIVAKHFGKFIVRALFVLSLWTMISMFFSSLGYVIFGADAFNITIVTITLVITSVIVLAWMIYPEWWVVTTIAIILAIAGSSFFGSSFTPIPIILLLVILSIYDYIAVIKTKFMLNFAKKVMSFQLPAAISLPYDKKSSLIKDGINFDDVENRYERGFMILGTGDLLFPTILAVSTSVYTSTTSGIIIGAFIIISYLIMMYTMYYSKYSSKIQALPGLPFLCSGAIIGYIITLGL